MSRYWVIAPGKAEPAEQYDKVWQFDLANDLISIGWNELGDVSRLSKEQLLNAVAVNYHDRPPQTKTLFANMIWSFYHDIKIGDIILARRGRRILAGVGTVDQTASYLPDLIPEVGHANVLRVKWNLTPRDKVFPNIVFPMHTLMSISTDKATELLGASPVTVLQESEELIEDTQSFILEKYLEDFIVSNFDSIFDGKLSIYSDSEGNDGQQYNTEVGSIDILATESHSGDFVVIELKKGRPSDQVVGQILRYMGWVKKNLCSKGQKVRGLIICRDHDSKLSYALEMANEVNVRYYSVVFKLLNAPKSQ